MKYVDTLKYHLENPSETVDSFARRKHLDLSSHIRPAKKVYLDTNFWVDLCNAHTGRPVRERVSELAGVLEDLVSRHLIVCPISAATFAEIFKQTDPHTLKTTVQIVDSLSQGIAILDSEERVRLEVFHFVREKTHRREALHPLADLVWTRVAYVLGFTSPTLDTLPQDMDTAVQKAFVDQMWSVSLTDMLDVLGDNAALMPRLNDYSEKLNRGKFAHLHDHSSFNDLFLAELAGMLDVYRPTLADLMRHLLESSKQSVDEDATRQAGTALANEMYQAFRSNKITNELPSFRVNAGLHAAVRWDAKRKYKPNDAHDFHHAVAAVPYCDFFLTDGSLRQLVNDKRLQFSSFFSCRTFSDISDAHSALTQIGGLN